LPPRLELADVQDIPEDIVGEANQVAGELAAAGIQISDQLTQAFAIYLRRVREWGRRMNLVSARDLERVGRRHLLESFNLLFFPLDLADGPLADAGSGAGFPGLPLALAVPNLEVLLIESIRKKALFLERMVAELGLGERVQVRAERAEALAASPAFRERFAVVTMRGFGPLSRGAQSCALLLRPGGHLVGFKGTRFEKELRETMPVMSTLGLELVDVVPLRWGEGRLVVLRRKD
jgi:16S rRNA (guanine527-N7)-methyltransferase